jgi:hypothetical protein
MKSPCAQGRRRSDHAFNSKAISRENASVSSHPDQLRAASRLGVPGRTRTPKSIQYSRYGRERTIATEHRHESELVFPILHVCREYWPWRTKPAPWRRRAGFAPHKSRQKAGSMNYAIKEPTRSYLPDPGIRYDLRNLLARLGLDAERLSRHSASHLYIGSNQRPQVRIAATSPLGTIFENCAARRLTGQHTRA